MSGTGFQKTKGMQFALGGLYYQFITTGPEIIRYDDGGIFPVYRGSAVAMKLPTIQSDGSVVWDNITPIATGSTLEILPDGTPIAEHTALIQRIKGSVQVQLFSEPSYRFHPSLDSTFNYRSYKQLIYSWSSMPGRIYNAGVFMLAPSGTLTDKAYDAPPTTISNKELISHEPDMDWHHDAAIIRVTSEEFGSRAFIVAVDASSRFYCWPYQSDETDELVSPYAHQGQRVNVPDSKVTSLEAPFPSWVHVPVGDRRDTDWPITVNSGEPRYAWRFHPQGTKVVGLVLQREILTGKVYGQTLANPTYLKFTQVEVGDIELDFDTPIAGFLKRTDISGIHPLQNDTPGYVEFSIDLVLTGLEENDFTFGLTLLREQQTDATHYPIAADYLSPVFNGWSHYGINGSPGDLVVMNLDCYTTQRERTWIDRYCGFAQRTDESVLQTWANVVNIETSTTLANILLKNQPEEFNRKSFDPLLLELDTYQAQLSSIDLSKMSWIYKATKNHYFHDEEPYWTNPRLIQRRNETQVGVRFYVFGKKVKEQQSGTNLDLWNSLDNIELIDDAIRFDPTEIHTRWLKSQFSFTGRLWFITEPSGYLLFNIFYDIDVGTSFTRDGYFDGYPLYNSQLIDLSYPENSIEQGHHIATNEQMKNVVLNQLSYLDNDTSSGISYTWPVNHFIDETSVGTITDPANNNIVVMQNNYEKTFDTLQTPIFSKLTANCPTCDENYLDDVFMPWVLEMKALTESVPVSPGSVTVDVGFIWYDPNNNNNPVPFYIHDTAELYYAVMTNKEESRYGVPIYTYLEDYYYKSHETDHYLPTYTANNRHQRIYDYPIGKELFMREWHQSIEQGTPLLFVSPEGFYAGTMIQIPYYTGSIPNGSVEPDETYQKSYNYMYGRYLESSNAYYTEINEPNINQFSFFTMDAIGHVNNETTISHQTLYETAYHHELGIENPPVRIRVENGDYIYEKSYTVDGESDWVVFESGLTDLLAKPVIAGSMLFSK